MVRIILVEPIKGYLTIKEGTAFPLNFSIGDIRDISKRNGSYSKTITLVGNKENNVLLGHIYDINISNGTFDINKLQKCIVEQDGIVILDNMYIQLKSVKKVQKTINYDYEVEYEAQLGDSSSDLFSKISNKELTDLNFNDFNDHNYTASAVTSSFTHTWVDGYKYILPWKNPLAIINNAHLKYILKDFRAGIYVRQYWDRIFAMAGYRYTFAEMDDDSIQFNKLIIPYNGDDIKVEDNVDITVSASGGPIVKTIVGGIGADMFKSRIIASESNAPSFFIINNEISDVSNQYNPVTGIFQPAFSITGDATIKFKFFVEYEVRVTFNDNVTLKSLYGGSTGKNIVKPSLIIKNTTNGVELSQPFETFDINIGSTFTVGTHLIVQNSIGFSLSMGNLTTLSQIREKISLSVQDTASFSNPLVWMNNVNYISYGRYELTITNITMEIEPKDISLDYNMPVNVNSFIPRKIKQSDFIRSICQLYNLFLDVDKNDETNIIVKTRDKYYDDGVVVDWSLKLAKDFKQELKFLPELSAKKVLLTYKQDSDIANKGYLDNTNEVYGQVEYVFDNEFVKGEDKKEVIFSPTPNDYTAFGANVPIINGFTPKNNIRILLDNGSKSCETYYITDIAQNTVTTYPFISHFNDDVNPSFDINYGTCDYYFYDDINITNNNLFNLHWMRTFSQINSGKLLTAFFNLTAVDIQKLSLDHKIRIDNSLWSINKIMDFNANSNSLTMVELISIDDSMKLGPYKFKKPIKEISGRIGVLWNKTGVFNYAPGPLTTVQGTANVIDSGANAYVSGDENTINTSGTLRVMGDENILNSPGEIVGDDNFIDYDVSGIFVVGDSNTVEAGVESSMIVGDGNTIESGLAGVFILGSDIVATEPGLYVDSLIVAETINGVNIDLILGDYWYYGYSDDGYVGPTPLATKSILTTTGDTIMGSIILTDYIYFVDGPHLMSFPAPNQNRYTIKNIYSASTTIDTVGSELIEGATSITLPYLSSIDIISDGINWYII